jgi:hypothetical protein
MKDEKATYTLWIGVSLIATRPHTTENYIDLLGIASETSGHARIYSTREDAPVYDSKIDYSPDEDEPVAYDGYEGCWPGDGSGMDDLADYNQMEGYDY